MFPSSFPRNRHRGCFSSRWRPRATPQSPGRLTSVLVRRRLTSVLVRRRLTPVLVRRQLTSVLVRRHFAVHVRPCGAPLALWGHPAGLMRNTTLLSSARGLVASLRLHCARGTGCRRWCARHTTRRVAAPTHSSATATPSTPARRSGPAVRSLFL